MSEIKPQKILVVRFSSIGDIVLCSPVIRCLKLQLGAEIHFITKRKFEAVINTSPYVDKVITIESKVKEVQDVLYREGYDLVVDLHKNIRSLQVRSFVNAKYITFDKINVQKWLAVHTPINLLPDKHLIDRYMHSLKRIGIRYDGQGLDHFVSAEEVSAAMEQVQGQYVALSLGATYKTKRLPLERLIPMVEAISLPIVLLGGPDVRSLADDLATSSQKQLLNLVGKITLGTSSAVVSQASYVISGDSGMMHIAAAHRRPLIVPWGSTHPILGMYPFYPSNSKVPYIPLVLNLSCQPCSKVGKDSCPKQHFKCMLELTDQMLHSAIAEMESKVLS